MCHLCVYQECVAEITGRFEKTVLSLDTLLQDTYFDAFTQPIINKKVKKKCIAASIHSLFYKLAIADVFVHMCMGGVSGWGEDMGDGPSLEEILEDDAYLQDIILNIKVIILF